MRTRLGMRTPLGRLGPAVLMVATLIALLASPAAAHSLSPPPGPHISEGPEITAAERASLCWPSKRATSDRPDRSKGKMVHVVYLVAPDTPDERLDEKGILDCSVRAWNQWFAEQTEGLKWRIDVYRAKSAGRRRELVDVTFVQSSRSAEELVSPGGVGAELEAQGLEDPNKKYVAYVEAQSGNVCGSAAYPVTGPDPTDPFSGDGQYAYVYLLSDPDCHSRDFGIPGKPSFPEGTVMHELLHTEAVVPIGAPHHCLFDLGIPPVGHVCTGPLGLGGALVGADLDPESEDVMFPFAGTALSENVLDRDRDDYFDHPFPYRDLADSPYLSRR